MQTRTIKRIFTDMDGALLNSKGQVSERNARRIRRAAIPITLVSARAPMEMREAIELLGLQGPQVGFNGGLIYEVVNHQIRPLHIKIIFKQTAATILQAVRQHFPQVSLSYYDLNHWYCDTIDEGIRYEYDLTHQAPTQVHDEDCFLSACDNLFKIMMISFEEEEMQDLQAYLNSLGLSSVTILRSGRFYLEITSKEARKSSGIDYISRKENLKKEETAAFGDSHNDIPMLEMVGFPIVMANAFKDVKAHAFKITKSNDEDGVGYGIHRYLVS